MTEKSSIVEVPARTMPEWLRAKVQTSRHEEADRYYDLMHRKLAEKGIPGHMWNSIIMYVMIGSPFGDFLRNVVSDSLFNAYHHADLPNIRAMRGYVMFFYNNAPGGCWGSEQRYREWCDLKGLFGIRENKPNMVA